MWSQNALQSASLPISSQQEKKKRMPRRRHKSTGRTHDNKLGETGHRATSRIACLLQRFCSDRGPCSGKIRVGSVGGIFAPPALCRLHLQAPSGYSASSFSHLHTDTECTECSHPRLDSRVLRGIEQPGDPARKFVVQRFLSYSNNTMNCA